MAIYNGTQKIKVSGVGKIYVGTQLVYQEAAVLTSITLSGQTTSLNRGAAFSFGGTVTAHYDNGNTADVTSSTTFSGYNMNKAGTYTVTASYTENGVTKTATYSLTVNKAWSAVWSGTKQINWSDTTASAPSNVSIGNYNLTGKKVRVTFSYSINFNSGYGTKKYKNYGSEWSTTAISSPLANNSLDSSLQVLGIQHYRDTNNYAQIVLIYSSGTWQLVASKGSQYSPYGTTHNMKLTITKIEQYY